MAIPTNALSRFGLNTTNSGDNIREDLADVIYNVDPTETPFVSNAARESSQSDFIEWLEDSFAAAADTPHIEGDDFSGDALTPANRLGNYHQITRKDFSITRRADVLRKAGRRSEVAYQVAKAGQEVKRSIEFIAVSQKAAATGNATTPPQTAGLGGWIRTNINQGSGASAPTLSSTNSGYPDAIGTRAGGAGRSLDESDFLGVQRLIYDATGKGANMALLNPRMKQSFSNYLFASSSRRIAAPQQDFGAKPGSGATVIGAVDMIMTDFGMVSMTPDIFAPKSNTASTCYMLNSDYWCLSYITPYRVYDIAKSGDSMKKMVLADWTVKSKNEKSSGALYDLDQEEAVAA